MKIAPKRLEEIERQVKELQEAGFIREISVATYPSAGGRGEIKKRVFEKKKTRGSHRQRLFEKNARKNKKGVCGY